MIIDEQLDDASSVTDRHFVAKSMHEIMNGARSRGAEEFDMQLAAEQRKGQ